MLMFSCDGNVESNRRKGVGGYMVVLLTDHHGEILNSFRVKAVSTMGTKRSPETLRADAPPPTLLIDPHHFASHACMSRRHLCTISQS